MTNRDPILVGVDGSEPSSAALRYGAHEALRQGTSIQLVHVVPNYMPMSPMLPLPPSVELRDVGRHILDQATQQAQQLLAPENVDSSLLGGARIPALVRAAEHARLVVLGAQHHAAVERVLTGSALAGVASRATCPVVAVPADWTPTQEHHTVVAGVKDTQHSSELVRRALQIAAERNARLILIHTWELQGGYDDMITSRVESDEWADRERLAIEKSISGTRQEYADVPVEIRVIHGQAARELQRASDEADLLLVARHHHAIPFGHLGGTGRAVLRESHCPVEVVPPADEPTTPSDLDLEQAGSLPK